MSRSRFPLPYLIWDRSPFFLMQEVVWNYGAGVAARKSLSPRNEKFLWYVKNADDYTFNLDAIRDPDVKYPNQKKNGKLRCNTIGKNPSDVWRIAKVTSGRDRASPERTPHPAQFPLDLIDRIVLGFSNAGDLVMDPFMGSGTVAVSCLQQGRPVIGFELNRDYPRVGCALLTGGGVRFGQIIGSSDAAGEAALRDDVTPDNLAASIYQALGVDHHLEYETATGRPVQLVAQGTPIRGLLG